MQNALAVGKGAFVITEGRTRLVAYFLPQNQLQYKTYGKKNIGVFDSGFGGINILKGLTAKLPQYNYVYLADNARASYGNRASQEICNFTEQAVNFLAKSSCELIIFACNTVSSEAQTKLRSIFPKKHFLGVLEPLATHAAQLTKNNRIGVMATERTVSSKAFITQLHIANPNIKVYQQSCPKLVPIIEQGKHNNREVEIILKTYLSELIERNIDTLVLGCTHYGILEDKIKGLCNLEMQIVAGQVSM